MSTENDRFYYLKGTNDLRFHYQKGTTPGCACERCKAIRALKPPVRDIREAMHPAGAGEDADPPSERPKWNPIAVLPPVVVAGAVFAEARTEVTRPHVATLPDGTRLNLPAGTVLREGEGTPPPVRFFDLANSLRAAFARVDEAVLEPAAPMDLVEVEQLIRAWDALKAEMVAQEKINAPVRVVAPPEHERGCSSCGTTERAARGSCEDTWHDPK